MTPWQRIRDAIAEMIRGPLYHVHIYQWWPGDGEKPGLTTHAAYRARNREAALQEAIREAYRGAEPGFTSIHIEVTGP